MGFVVSPTGSVGNPMSSHISSPALLCRNTQYVLRQLWRVGQCPTYEAIHFGTCSGPAPGPHFHSGASRFSISMFTVRSRSCCSNTGRHSGGPQSTSPSTGLHRSGMNTTEQSGNVRNLPTNDYSDYSAFDFSAFGLNSGIIPYSIMHYNAILFFYTFL